MVPAAWAVVAPVEWTSSSESSGKPWVKWYGKALDVPEGLVATTAAQYSCPAATSVRSTATPCSASSANPSVCVGVECAGADSSPHDEHQSELATSQSTR